MAGATAATAAGVTASQAGLVTINLTDNFISATGGNHLNADLTGDGQPDLIIANAFNLVTTNGNGPVYTQYIARVNLNGVLARADAFRYDLAGSLQLGSQHKIFGTSSHSGSLTGSPHSLRPSHARAREYGARNNENPRKLLPRSVKGSARPPPGETGFALRWRGAKNE
jgi:hypothetical protein